MLQQGSRLNDTYTILEELGTGGGGVVYKAYHERLQTYVVVKQIKERVKGVLNNRGEADILKRIKHTNLPRVYDFLEVDGEVFTVMDFVPGESLDKVLKLNQRFDAKTVYQWALQLADALDYLHRQEPPIIHSDIKPANIMLEPDGSVCLIDFNISLAFDSSIRTSAGISGGYSPPEQHHSQAAYLSRVQTDGLSGKNAAWRSREEIRPELPTRAVTETKRMVVSELTEAAPGTVYGDRTEVMFDAAVETVPVDKTELMTGAATEAMTGAATEVMSGVVTEAMTGAAAEAMRGSENAAVINVMAGAAPPSGSRIQSGLQSGPQSVTVSGTVTDFIGQGIDERSDIYSLGATLYHLLTGVKPTVNFDEIVPLRQFDLRIGEGFLTIVEKMMELDPQKRYQNGGELKYALEHIFELDSEYIRYKKKNRTWRIVIAALYIGGGVLTAVGVSTYHKESVSAYNHYVQEANILIDKAGFDQADEAIKKAWDIDSKRAEAYGQRVYMLYSEGKYEECVNYGLDVINNPLINSKAPEEAQTLADIYYLMGNACYEQEDYADAVSFFQKAIEKKQENSLYFRDYAIALAKTGYVEDADKALKAAIELGLGEDSIYMVQGEIALARDKGEEAIEYLRQSIRTTTDEELRRRATILCAQIYRELGNAYLDQEIGLLESAENTFGANVSLHIQEQLADAYTRKAGSNQMYEKEYYPKAIEKFESLYEQGYGTRQILENIAILYEQTGQLDTAESVLNEMLSQYPDDYHAYKRLAFLEAERQQAKANEERDYTAVREYYQMAREMYKASGEDGDTEMQMLENMMQDLKDGGWF